MVVQHNLTAMNANRYLGINNNKLSKSLEKLSSGYAINRAGDNAAGLAVSEKMRSQIAGMTQAVKNAQDGISMVQTFEGALTETDSILQRMKTLATQMANGSYDDPVDRTAAQQEFLQLNDELDQIADTDFNGVVVLNGGVMADGTCADGVTAEFGDDGHVTSKDASAFTGSGVVDYKAAKEAAAAAADAADAAADADAELLKTATDFCDDKVNGVGSLLDNANYDKTDADAVWDALGLEVTSTDVAKPDEIQVTFTYDGSAWKATGVTDGAGKAIDVDADKLAALGTSPYDNGGFTIDGTDLNLVFDTHDVQKYDTATVKLQNANVNNYAPTNMGIKEDSLNTGATTGSTKASEYVAPTFEVKVTDADMSADVKAALDKLQGMDVTFTCTNGTSTYTLDATKTAVAADATKGITGGTIALAADGKTIQYTKTGDTTAVAIAEIKSAANTGVTLGAGAKFTLNMDAYNYGNLDGLKANSVATPTASKPTAAAADAADADSDEAYAVSKSDAFSNSEAKMTYTNNITLQVGARTKDAVNFTFKYASTSIGDLTPDLDCTAYGLGTNVLNLNDQKSANEAIDKIDQAINKVSLVRGTFGAIQNRLEHKIDNLNVSVENLTSAESQIRDTDMPTEMMNFTKQQILAQASQSMLAQANQLPQGVLSLLQ